MKTKLVIFGITGDLSRRKLIPALNKIFATEAGADLSLIGVSRREIDTKELLGSLDESTQMVTMDVSKAEDYRILYETINIKEGEQVLIYLSVPPSASDQIVMLLGQNGFSDKRVKLLLEKPFGVDFESAEEMNGHLLEYFDESQLYRIDHYMAKEMAQNIIAFRADNALFSHVWNNNAIERVTVGAYESIGIEGRSTFYEQTGAMRDVLQGHLMQLLSIILMEIPEDVSYINVPTYRLKALSQINPVSPSDIVRAQYRGYRKEVGSDSTTTETYVSTTLYSEDENWRDVPLVLRTGKALHSKLTEIVVEFKKTREEQANKLIFRIQPFEGVEIELHTKRPGYERVMETRSLAFSYPEDLELPDAYEQVIVDAIYSRKSLFTSSDEVLASWRILEPALKSWSMEKVGDIGLYEPQSTPEEVENAIKEYKAGRQ